MWRVHFGEYDWITFWEGGEELNRIWGWIKEGRGEAFHDERLHGVNCISSGLSDSTWALCCGNTMVDC